MYKAVHSVYEFVSSMPIKMRWAKRKFWEAAVQELSAGGLYLPLAVEKPANLGEIAVALYHIIQHRGLHQESVVTLESMKNKR